jgi:hypothetical protein
VHCVRITLGRTKTITAGQGAFVFAASRAAVDLHEWMQADKITSGPIFREVRKDGSIGTDPLTVQSVNLILKKRCRMVGLDSDGISRVDAKCQSARKSVQEATGYYDEQEHAQSQSVRIAI